MTKRSFIVFAILLLFFLVRADNAVVQLLDAVSNEDVIGEQTRRPTTLFIDYPGARLTFCTSNDVEAIARIAAVATNLAFSSESQTNQLSRLRLSTAIMLLGEYADTQCAPILVDIMTNATSEEAVFASACYVGSGLGPGQEVASLLNAPSFQGMTSSKIHKAYLGLFSGMNSLKGDASATNRIVTIALNGLAYAPAWCASDVELCHIWPGFTTSSNRYMTALSIRSSIPSSFTNYLNRVISELESLPPGTMQMLSTNHLGAAWNED